MTIILKFFLNFIKKKKYDNLQYDNYFKKIVIFEFQNMTKKKPMGGGREGIPRRPFFNQTPRKR